jgi:hypothetical protein
MDIDGDGGRRAFGLRVQLRGTGSLREPPQISGQGKIAAQQIRHGTADKPIAKRQVVNNSARTALIAGTAGSKFQPGRYSDSKRELKRGDGLLQTNSGSRLSRIVD